MLTSRRYAAPDLHWLAPLALLAALLCLVLPFRFAASTLQEPGPDSPGDRSALASLWTQGEAIVLVRHMERCDRSAAPCLDAAEGITVRGTELAAAMGEAFARLGLQRADVFTSPITRARQTATAMFKAAVAEREWLGSCKALTVGELSRHKVEGRNLVLVTHSHCIEQIEKEVRLPAARELSYGALLFIAVDGKKRTPAAAGLIDAEHFVVGFGAAR